MLKTEQHQYGAPRLNYLKDVARMMVKTFAQNLDNWLVEPKTPTEWEPDWQNSEVQTGLLKYETDWSLFNTVGYGDSIGDVV